MFRRLVLVSAFIAAYALFAPSRATVSAFQGQGCMGKCTDCHSLTKEEAAKLLSAERLGATIKDIRISPVKGLWEIEVTRGDKPLVVYMDFAKKFLVEARFTTLEQLSESTTLKKLDVSRIPLEGAIVMGSPTAEKKVIVFDDPECPYCKKLHKEIKKILEKRKDVAFFIKMYPLPTHPDAYEKSKAIVCSKSAKVLDDAFSGKKLSKAQCDTPEVDNNIKLAGELGINGTPALILPDGRLFPSYATAEVILGLIDNQEAQQQK